MYVVVRCQSLRTLALLELGRLDDARAEAQATASAAEDVGLMLLPQPGTGRPGRDVGPAGRSRRSGPPRPIA